ncbi:hypothetical protein ACEWY4_006015 [Coilia grayii]|uniref:ubiquitinyl hydrolase 1 n=1 Tax=Coilia grayii TaxID=363190 RepID=A0ABD1KCF3_9TELE
MSSSPPGNKKKDKRILSGSCPDPECQARLFFPAHGAASIECTECGQRHEQKSLLRVEEVTDPDPDVVLHNLLRHALLGAVTSTAPKKKKAAPELVKVSGLSNYHCKLLSPILTLYGMDRRTGTAKLLSELLPTSSSTSTTSSSIFDCSLLSSHAFLIDPAHLPTPGYGRDRSGSLLYLQDTLRELLVANSGQERLVPIHVDGDGHCLVHAVSRALVGRELFWHALRENLKRHFTENLLRYRTLFSDFIAASEWDDIISECDPLFTPPEGIPLGLRNVHIFGLANVLRRPIVLLDSLSGMRSSGDYSATFLPGLVSPESCQSKAPGGGVSGVLNKPICLAWSSSAHNHYIPLVGVKGAEPARLPARLLPKAWGVPQHLIGRYVDLDTEGGCAIGGERSLGDAYLKRLTVAMDAVFVKNNGIPASLVSDVHHYVFRRRGVVGSNPEEVTSASRRWLDEGRLHRCLACGGVSELSVPPDWLSAGGKLHALAVHTHDALQHDRSYSFPLSNLVCVYDAQSDLLVPDYARSAPAACHTCHSGALRPLTPSGGVAYRDGDRTDTPSFGGKCGCGFKHFWGGREYDNLPEALPVSLEWGGRAVRETVYWWQHESDSALNSNAYEVAARLVDAHFPGEFGSEPLVQKVVTSILQQTQDRQRRRLDQYRPVSVEHPQVPGPLIAPEAPSSSPHHHQLPPPTTTAPDPPPPPSKIILMGQKSKTLHREELTMSKAELRLQQSVRDHAPQTQQRSGRPIAAKSEAATANHSQIPSQLAAPAPASASAPPTPTKAPPPPRSDEKKVRVTTSDGRQATLTLRASTNHAEFRRAVAEAFGVPAERQRIRVGFPPRLLPCPKEAANQEEDRQPVPLQHGDRVSVEILRGEDSELNGGEGEEEEEEERRGGEREREREREERLSQADRELQDNIDLEISSLCLLATLMGEDVWSYAKKLPHLFQPGGVFYNIVKKDMGLLDGKHFSLPQLPGRVFAYSCRDDRLELCVDHAPFSSSGCGGHFPISPCVDELVAASNQTQAGRSQETEESRGHAHSLGGVVAVRKKKMKEGEVGLHAKGAGLQAKEAGLQGVTAFKGKGHWLGGSPPINTPPSSPSHRPITRQQDSQSQLAPPPELVRVAPGFVTTATTTDRRQGVGLLDPVAVETQRRRLQEMVSSIQASMDRQTHTHTHLTHTHLMHTHSQEEVEKEKGEGLMDEEREEPMEPMDQS